MTTLWRLTALGPFALLRAARERLDAHDELPALSVCVFEDGADGEGRLDALFDGPADPETFLALAELEAEALEISFGPMPEEDWVALSLAGLPPVEAGRFVVHGAHVPAKDLPARALPILIEAGPAFGTGHHGTTQGCLIAVDRLQRDGFSARRVLDLGCGTGALAIGAALIWPDAEIFASDIDPVAVDETVVNAERNGVAHRIEAFTADGFDHDALAGPFDLILANILAGPLQDLARALVARLSLGGVAILSGLLPEQEASVRAAYEGEGLSFSASEHHDGWVVLRFRAATLLMAHDGVQV